MLPIPYSVTNPTSRIAYITLCIIVLNVAFYFGAVYGGDITYVWEMLGFSTSNVSALTLLSHQFLHGSTMHLLGNMWFLWLFGSNLEDLMGKIGFTIYYLVGGAVSALIFKATAGLGGDADAVHKLIGASGAISCVMGGYFVLFPRSGVKCVLLLGWVPIPFKVPAIFFLGLYFVMQFVMLKMMKFSSIAYTAHIGGFAFGAGVLYLLILSKAVIVPNFERVKKGEYALIGPQEKFIGALNAAYETGRFTQLPTMFRRLKLQIPETYFGPEEQSRVGQALKRAGDFRLSLDAYREIMVHDPEHQEARKAGLEIAKILEGPYKDVKSARAYIEWVFKASQKAGVNNIELRSMMKKLGLKTVGD